MRRSMDALSSRPAAGRALLTAAALLGTLICSCARPRPGDPVPPGPTPAAQPPALSGPEPASAATPRSPDAAPAPGLRRLPTGAWLDPEGTAVDLGTFPLSVVLSPDGRHAIVLLSGWREQGLQVVDLATSRVTQTLEQPAGFLGLAFSRDGRTIYASGGNQDLVYVYGWDGARATLRDSLSLHPPHTEQAHVPGEPSTPAARQQVGERFPAGLALSPDGRWLYVAENMADSLAVVDLAAGRVVQRLPAGRYPYGVVVGPGGSVYVSAWGGRTVTVFRPDSADAGLETEAPIIVGRHPSALLLSADGSRLYVASASTDRVLVVDTRTSRLLTRLLDPPPEGPAEGSTPNGLALSPDGTRLFVAEADANAVAVFDLSPATSGVAAATGADTLSGRIPADWYPTAIALRGNDLLVLSGKGRGSEPNPDLEHPGMPRHGPRGHGYTLAQLEGTLRTVSSGAIASGATLDTYTRRVAAANGWDSDPGASTGYPPIRHVIYVIKENRTYDQVLGDLPEGDGDTALVFFGRPVSPNHHALAERFGLFDRFFVNAEVSADGHNWSTAAYATDYLEKTVQSNYSQRRRDYDYEGTNRGVVPPEGEDAAEPANGYLWDLANRAGITFRNYGEFVMPADADDDGPVPVGYRATKPYLQAHTHPSYPGFDVTIPDQHRADIFLSEFQQFERSHELPQLIIIRLPNDHTAGGRAGAPTPRAYMADNDLALGRIVDAISHSEFWKSTAIFVLEDDAQNGPDHVDSHRSPLLVISPYSRGGVIHRFANTTDVIATMSELLGLGHLSQFDYYGRPLRGIWRTDPDLRPYDVLTPAVSLDEKNAPDNPGARPSQRLDLRFEDSSDDDFFNLILWRMIKGPDRPYPGASRLTMKQAVTEGGLSYRR